MNPNFNLNPKNVSKASKLGKGEIFMEMWGGHKLGQNRLKTYIRGPKGHFQIIYHIWLLESRA